jgi:hypothetical protein
VKAGAIGERPGALVGELGGEVGGVIVTGYLGLVTRADKVALMGAGDEIRIVRSSTSESESCSAESLEVNAGS